MSLDKPHLNLFTPFGRAIIENLIIPHTVSTKNATLIVIRLNLEHIPAYLKNRLLKCVSETSILSRPPSVNKMRSQTRRSPKFQQSEAEYTLGAILLGIPHDVEYQLYPLKKVNGKTLIPEIIGNSTLIALLLECKLLSFKKDLFSILNKMEGLTNIVATSKINDGSVKVIINVKQIRVHGKRAGRHVFVKMICSNNCSLFPLPPKLDIKYLEKIRKKCYHIQSKAAPPPPSSPSPLASPVSTSTSASTDSSLPTLDSDKYPILSKFGIRTDISSN